VRKELTPELRGVHTMPSSLVMIVPLPPTATRRVPVQAMPNKLAVELALCEVQVTPSGLVRAVPPTATSCEPVQATAQRLAVDGDVWRVQVMPSGLVTIAPWYPTATSWLPVQATPPSWLPCGRGFAQLQLAAQPLAASAAAPGPPLPRPTAAPLGAGPLAMTNVTRTRGTIGRAVIIPSLRQCRVAMTRQKPGRADPYGTRVGR
jgi:hypothetical protein